jgi:hypothetical protein
MRTQIVFRAQPGLRCPHFPRSHPGCAQRLEVRQRIYRHLEPIHFLPRSGKGAQPRLRERFWLSDPSTVGSICAARLQGAISRKLKDLGCTTESTMHPGLISRTAVQISRALPGPTLIRLALQVLFLVLAKRGCQKCNARRSNKIRSAA